MERIPTVSKDDDLKKAVKLLKEHGVALLLNDEKKPVGIRTLCNIDEVSEKVQELLARGVNKAGELFPKTKVHTVPSDAPLSDVVREVLNKQLDTGIAVVDEQGVYKGYVFASKLRDKLAFAEEKGQRELLSEAERMKRLYPRAARQIDEWAQF
jgi:CBS-domain-containing membrane protein